MTDYVTDFLYFAGRVKRYHSWPTTQSQTIGEHSWQVALIYERIFGELSPPVERYIRLHDVAELVAGDIPFPVKAENPELKVEFEKVEHKALLHMGVGALPDLPDSERKRIKICDLLEMMIFGLVEREMGNLLAIPIIQRTKAAALVLCHSSLTESEYGKVYTFVDDLIYRHHRLLKQERKYSGDY